MDCYLCFLFLWLNPDKGSLTKEESSLPHSCTMVGKQKPKAASHRRDMNESGCLAFSIRLHTH